MFGWLNGVVADSPLTYLLVAGLTLVDVTGLVPAETVIATATLLAVSGKLLLAGIGAAAVTGAVAGDNILYFLGARVGNRIVAWLFRGKASRERLDWARRQMHQHGSVIIIAGRFVPMGRTATMFAAGTLEVPWRRFIVADVIAVAVWAAYWVGVTAATGETFSGNPWFSLLFSLAVGTVIGLLAEVIRRYRDRRAKRSEATGTKA